MASANTHAASAKVDQVPINRIVMIDGRVFRGRIGQDARV